MAFTYGRMRMYDDMKREWATHVELLQGAYPLIRTQADASIAHLKDDRQTLVRLLPELETHLDEAGAEAYDIAGYYFYLGENDRGFEWLERYYCMKESSLQDVKWDPDLDSVRTDPRYLDFLKRVGLE